MANAKNSQSRTGSLKSFSEGTDNDDDDDDVIEQ